MQINKDSLKARANNLSITWVYLKILFMIDLFDNVDNNILKKAFEETCRYRGFNISKKDAFSLLI